MFYGGFYIKDKGWSNLWKNIWRWYKNKYFDSSLGDYFALAIGNKYFKYTKEGNYFKSAHAGFTIDEMKIPLIIINKKSML